MKYKCRLKVIFAEYNIKQIDFAKSIGISEASMSAIVNSKYPPKFDAAYMILDELENRIGKKYRLQEIWVKNNS